MPPAPARHDDLKEMLDTNKDSLKLEAMKRIVAVSEEGDLGVGGRDQRAAPLGSLRTFRGKRGPPRFSSPSLGPTPQMIARGKNASDLFPAVVKNVACKNIEVSASREGSPRSR